MVDTDHIAGENSRRSFGPEGLPVKDFHSSHVTNIGAHLSSDQPSQGKPRLLLVEDQPSEWIFFGDMLSAEYDVKVAMNGEEAWEAVQLQLPDVILSDVLMPVLDGVGLAQRLRADARTAQVPLILMTASNKKDLPALGLEAGMAELLFKPFNLAELLDRLRCHRRPDAVPPRP